MGAPKGFYSAPSQMSFSSPCRMRLQPPPLRHQTLKRKSEMKCTRVIHEEIQTEGGASEIEQSSGKVEFKLEKGIECPHGNNLTWNNMK